jgi:hypothetical protein
MGPAAAQPGDQISLLYKTSCPIILHQEDSFYRIIGGSYIAALTTPKTQGIPHPIDDLASGALKPVMVELR